MTTTDTTFPAYLRTRNGRLELVLHCTWGQDYDLCAQKFHLRYGAQIEGTGPKSAPNYGAAVHEALAVRYGNPERSLAQIQLAQDSGLQQWFEKNPQLDTEWRNCGRAMDLVHAYNAEYPAHDWEVLAVEEEFEVVVGEVTVDGQTCLVVLKGRKDLVVAWHGGLWIIDHKTAQDWGLGDSNSHLDEGRMSFQFRGYPWAEREAQRALQASNRPAESFTAAELLRARLPVLGTVGNYLISRKPYATDKPRANGKPALPRNQFHQEAYPFSAATLDEWREECLGMAAEVLRSHATGYWRRKRNACGHWGRCEFFDYCEAAPDQREALLSSSAFQPKPIEREL